MAARSMTLKADLSARGVDLRAPAGDQDILEFEGTMGLRLNNTSREIYSLFNGFEFADRGSQIFLWGLDEIARRNSTETHLRQGQCVAIGDLLIDSDFLIADLGRDAPVALLFEKRQVAHGVLDLVVLLSSGAFDFLVVSPEGLDQ